MSDHTIVIIWVMKLFFVQFFCVFLPPLLNSFCCFFYEDLQDLLEVTPKKDVFFIIGNWNAKVGSQETPGVTGRFGLGVLNEAGQRLTKFCQENALIIANIFQQHKRRLYTWIWPDGQYQNQTDCILCSKWWRSSIEFKKKKKKTRPGADCDSDHEFLITKSRLK